MELVVLNGPMQGLEFPLEESMSVIGRRSDAGVCLPLDPRISRRHARIELREDHCVLTDAGSGNGTFVGGVRLAAPTVVRPGDRLRVGRTFLEVRDAPSVDLAEPPDIRFTSGPDAQVSVAERPAEYAAQPPAGPPSADELQRRLYSYRELQNRIGALLDVPQLLEAIMDGVMALVPAERGYLILRDEKSGELTAQVERRRDSGDQQEGEPPISRTIVDRAIDEKVAILTTDAMSDERFPDAASVVAFQIRSAVCLPLIARQKALGIIHLDTRSATHVFTEDDLALLTGAASQAAMALDSAKLYSDLREAYDDLQRAQDHLVESEKLSTIGALSASIAHDIGNIVTPLIPLTEVLLEDSAVADPIKRVFERQLPQLVALTRRLLSFSAGNQLHLEQVDVNHVVSAALELVRTEAIHKVVSLELKLHPDSPAVVGDASQLDRVILNLALNAIQAMEDRGGTLTVTVGAEEDEVSISLADTGPGIAPENLPHLFQPFFSTKESGTGMGLFSCRRIIEDEHGGVIEVESEAGKGTTFTVHLPKVMPDPSAASAADDTTDGAKAEA